MRDNTPKLVPLRCLYCSSLATMQIEVTILHRREYSAGQKLRQRGAGSLRDLVSSHEMVSTNEVCNK